MAILLTGGTGKTSTHLANFLQDAKIPFLLASRKGEAGAPSGMHAVKFDWLDSSTYDSPFQHASLNGESISAIYLISPGVPDPVPSMTAFIDVAVKKYGVKRFVLLGGSTSEQDGLHVGKVWQHLVDLGVGYCVLRPTWFMENFSELWHFASIKDEGKIYTASGDGKVPFIAALDIAAVAFRALTDEKPHNTDYRVLGPELLTYDNVAAKLSSTLGREIKHVRLSEEEIVQLRLKSGLPEFHAKLLAYLEAGTGTGMEERSDDSVERVTGRAAQNFDSWVELNKTKWQ